LLYLFEKYYIPQFILAAFISSFIVVGVIDQRKGFDDIYPYSDWYLFSYVDRYQKILDIKYYNSENKITYLREVLSEKERIDLAYSLQIVSHLVETKQSNNISIAVKKILEKYKIDGEVTLVEITLEKMEYYKNKNTKGERDVQSWNF
jgi:hypothetical protein